MKKTALSISMFVLAILLLVPLASADTISITLANPVQSASAGDVLSFVATVNAIQDKQGPVYLVGDSAGVTGTLTVDDTPFLVNFPFVMSAGDSVTDVLFSVLIPADVAAGQYTGYFSILGGLNSDAQNLLSTTTFTVDVASASPVPEPATWALMGTGFGALMLIGFTRRQQAGFGRAA